MSKEVYLSKLIDEKDLEGLDEMKACIMETLFDRGLTDFERNLNIVKQGLDFNECLKLLNEIERSPANRGSSYNLPNGYYA